MAFAAKIQLVTLLKIICSSLLSQLSFYLAKVFLGKAGKESQHMSCILVASQWFCCINIYFRSYVPIIIFTLD
jgi:uncharacterized membrane protein YozB (DUF420 family)